MLLLLLVSPSIYADGMVFKGVDFRSFIPVTEDNQHAIIAHRNGQEAMLLAVNFNLEDNEKAFWLFPVPGKPEEVKADIIDVFPKIRGMNPWVSAQSKFLLLFGTQMLSQPYTWPFMCCMSSLGKAGKDISGFAVDSVVEKYGLRIEILSVEKASSLSVYLKEKEIAIPESELKPFSDYLNMQYSLVFVEIYSKEELLKEFPDYEHFQKGDKERWPAVFVEFPSDKIFFPLKPTGFYEEPVRIILKVLGYVKNENELSGNWSYDYYRQTNTEESLPDVFKSYITTEGPLYYTGYYFHGEAVELTDDMWMLPFEPKGIKYAQFVDGLATVGGGSIIIVLGIMLFLFQSWACAGITGIIFYRKWNSYAILGLGNIITLYGVYLLAKYSKSFPEAEPVEGEQKMKSFRLSRYGPKETKRMNFILLFSFLFMMSSIGLYILFTLPFYST